MPEPAIDACVFHEWKSSHDLLPYLSAGLRSLIMPPGGRAAIRSVTREDRYPNPMGDKAEGSYPAQGVPGSDFDLLVEQVLKRGKRERAVLGYGRGIHATGYYHVPAAVEIARAVNEWSAEHWLSRDERLYGLAVIVSQVPDEAAAEIRRAGRNERVVGVALGPNSLGRSYGHVVYHPIYAAASELGLPLVLQVGADTGDDAPIAGGYPSTFTETRVHNDQPIMTHVADMILTGVFQRFPGLKLLIAGAGTAWVPGFLWRLNYFWKADAVTLPWLKRLPSEVFREHIRIATNGLEAPPREGALAKLLGTIPWAESVLLYGSGYPDFDFEEPEQQEGRLPRAWHGRVFRQNALELFRWPARGGKQ